MINANAQNVIAQGTNLRFQSEAKRESESVILAVDLQATSASRRF
jgi:hypothetical protein